ncbi:uncharacterized protein K441DRAFT_663929 [Cenococcum geophilum 1.58]|uniref:uncharacterized protein n=1 Tax=Cenococcum geophilum 1.58 TaxID=794803 RepID=UPI00358DE825|nr:hypothetical protein K441DRAFT_663929 [Cenococcum geophilum 1.58]
MLKEKPHPKDWNNVTFYNKYYFSLGTEETHRIKRRSSKISLKAYTEQDLKLLILPSLLLDLLIMESLAHPIKKKFHLKRVEEEDIALERFIDVWEN